MLRRDYAISISREAASSASIREAVARVDGGFLVGIFPEGTRSDDGSVGPLKPGFIALLRRSRAPVVPIGIAGAGKALPRGAWFIRRQPCRVVVAEPISAEEIARLSARGQEATLVETIRQRMAEVHREAEEWLHSGE
jgi:1-acyl-sn-glycerol-3-phosphate acyltransferase